MSDQGRTICLRLVGPGGKVLARVDMVLMGPVEPLKVPLTLGVEGGKASIAESVTMDKLDIRSTWRWMTSRVDCTIEEILGGSMPTHVRAALQARELHLPGGGKVWALGDKLCAFLHNDLRKPAPLDLGTDRLIEGVAGEVSVIDRIPDGVRMLYSLEYSCL